MIMFLVINTSGLIIIPISIMVYRAQMGAAQPTDVFIPILLSTFISTLVGVIAVSIAQKINLINKPILILMGIICLFFSGLIYLFLSVSREDMGTYSTLIANILLFSVIILFILTGVRKKINVYDSFVEGAKEGFTTAVRIIPYLVAFLVGIAVFRTSGAMDFLVGGIGYVVGLCGVDTSFVGALPTALMKSGFVCRTHELRGTRGVGYHILHPCRLLRQRRYHQDPQRRHLWPDSRLLGYHSRYLNQLFIFLLNHNIQLWL